MLFLSIILIIGGLTTFTDLKSKKIYNQHLAIGAVLGLMATAYVALFRHENVLFQITNGLTAFLVGWVLHRSSFWKGGDAKLFALYAFLMPPPEFSHIPLSSIVSLFACSFISGLIILMPTLIKDIIANRQAIVNELFSPERRRALGMGLLTIVFFSWILFPIFYFSKITNPVVVLMILFVLFSWRYTKPRKYPIKFSWREYSILAIGFGFGFLTRLLLSPDSLSYAALMRYITMITVSSVISICIHSTFSHFKNYQERVPFAPLLFMGCLLSYTPFLTKFMHMVNQWNALLYH